MFAVIGLGAGVIGTSASNGLLILRKKLDPNFETQNKEPNILMNAGAWAVHMGVSSNVRYQLLNGMDMVHTHEPAPCFLNRPLFLLPVIAVTFKNLASCTLEVFGLVGAIGPILVLDMAWLKEKMGTVMRNGKEINLLS